MRNRSTFLAVLCGIGTLIAAGGCGSSSEAGSEGTGNPAAAINGEQRSGTAQTTSDSASNTLSGPALEGAGSGPVQPVVVIQTSMGDITVQLDPERADYTVDNFLSYVEKGHYDGTVFHQVHENYVVLAGGYTAELVEKPVDRTIYNQANNGLKNVRGAIAMARNPEVIDSATCQFFINVTDNPHLDHQSDASPDTYGYCVFGKVIDGMPVADAISRVEVKDTELLERTPVEPVVIRAVRRVQ
jgi:cyclophilin family peptidyl-prolyl cis-trans isomerase